MLEAIKIYFIPYLINSLSMVYSIHLLGNKKVNINDKNNFIVLTLFLFSSIVSTLFIDFKVRLIIMSIMLFIGSYILLRKDIKKLILLTFLCQIITCISEIISVFVILTILNRNFDIYNVTYIDSLFYNVFVSLFLIIFLKTKFIKNIYLKLIKITDKIRLSILLTYILLLLFVINVTTAISYISGIGSNYQFIYVNIIFLFIYMFIIIVAIKEKNEKIEFKEANKILINNLNEYEKMLDFQRVNNHENKNQLLVIKSMIERNDKKIINYINEIIKEKREDNELIYAKAKRIPSGGLQGLIYQKMLVMQEKNINLILNVSQQVRKIDLTNISSKMNYDICRIVGIILDNAIEEVIKFNKKDREIIISMYVDICFIIEISNRIKENIDVNKIFEKGFTTKDKGHGYGLSLLNKIVNENEKIVNDIRIVNNIFTQIVKIKM